MEAAFLVVGSYLLGAIPFGLITGKILKGVDIREHGSGNIGATNVGRTLGAKYGYAVFVIDVLKGLAPVLVATFVSGGSLSWGNQAPRDIAVACGLAAICGHVFPVYLSFRGGKGVATGCGVMVALAPVPALIALGVWLAVVGVWRYVSLASISAVLALLIAVVMCQRDPFGAGRIFFGFCVIIAMLVIFRHKSNIERLMNGTENKIGSKRKKAEVVDSGDAQASEESGD